eukprot:333457_1
MNSVYSLVILIQYSVIVCFMYGYDMHIRIQQQISKEKWREYYIPSFVHTRFSIYFIICSVIVFFTVLLSQNHHIYKALLPSLWTILILSDWNDTIWTAASFLMIKYGKRSNPHGLIITFIGIILIIFNYSAYYINFNINCST